MARKPETPLPVIFDAIQVSLSIPYWTRDGYMFIQKELNGSGALIGYRRMWLRLKTKYKLTVKRLVHIFHG